MTTRLIRFSAPAVILIGALLVSPLTASADGDEAPECAAVVVSPAGRDHGHGRWTRSFSVAEVSDLTFHVVLRHDLKGEHLLTIRLTTPHGYTFRVIDVPVKGMVKKKDHGHSQVHGQAMRRAEPGERLERRVPGYPYPVPVRPVGTLELVGKKLPSIDVDFPVAGTSIDNNSLYGRWKVVAYFDGKKTPCGPAASFQLKP